MDQLKQNLKKTDQVIFCGHSLGCALAYLAALWFQNHSGKNNFMVANFAPPKCGDANFCNMFNDCLGVFNVINDQDPVPKVPLAGVQCCNVINFNVLNDECVPLFEGDCVNNHTIDNYVNDYDCWGSCKYPGCTGKQKNVNANITCMCDPNTPLGQRCCGGGTKCGGKSRFSYSKECKAIRANDTKNYKLAAITIAIIILSFLVAVFLLYVIFKSLKYMF